MHRDSTGRARPIFDQVSRIGRGPRCGQGPGLTRRRHPGWAGRHGGVSTSSPVARRASGAQPPPSARDRWATDPSVACASGGSPSHRTRCGARRRWRSRSGSADRRFSTRSTAARSRRRGGSPDRPSRHLTPTRGHGLSRTSTSDVRKNGPSLIMPVQRGRGTNPRQRPAGGSDDLWLADF
jgi:hypothetical protein